MDSPTFIIIDEAWFLFKHPVFQQKIIDWLKVLRKKNVAMVMATQDILDAADNQSLIKSINDACLSKIFLPNANAVDDEFNALYGTFGLSHHQRQYIARGERKCDYYCLNPEGGRMVQFNITKEQLIYLATPTKADVVAIKEHMGDPDYHHWWEAHKGLTPSTNGAEGLVNE